MKTNWRKFFKTAIAGGLAGAALSLSSCRPETEAPGYPEDIKSRYARLDEILSMPVLKRELFTTPVIIETLELLRFGNSFLCRVRSTDGAEGISVCHSELRTLFPIFVRKLQPFFIGKDARDLDLLLERVHIYNLNFRLVGIALGVPLAIIEFAILRCDRVHELIKRERGIERDGRSLCVSTSLGGGSVPPVNIVAASDYVLLHGNGVRNPERMAEMIRQVRKMDAYRPMPVVNNEDDQPWRVERQGWGEEGNNFIATAHDDPFEFHLGEIPDREHWVKVRAIYKSAERQIILESPYYRNPWWPYGGPAG